MGEDPDLLNKENFLSDFDSTLDLCHCLFWFGTFDDPPPRLLGVMWDAPSSTAKSTAPIGAPNAALTPAAAPAATKSRVSTFAIFALQIARNSEYLRAITFSQHPHLSPALTESLIEGSHLQS